MDLAQIRQCVRDGLRRGELPRTRQARAWGGPGGGQPCNGCGEVIARDDIEIELQFFTDEGFSTYRFHTLCHAVWEMER